VRAAIGRILIRIGVWLGGTLDLYVVPRQVAVGPGDCPCTGRRMVQAVLAVAGSRITLAIGPTEAELVGRSLVKHAAVIQEHVVEGDL